MPQTPAPTVDPGTIHRLTRGILNQSRFQRPGPSLVQRVQDAIGRALTRALLAALSGGGSLVGSLVLLAIVVVLLLLLLRFARTVRRSAAALPAPLIGRPIRPPADWAADADAHARAGRWRDAVRCRYRWAVAALAERGVVQEYEGRTTGEYRRAVQAQGGDLSPPFDELTELFERGWYGDDPLDAEASARSAVLGEAVLKAAMAARSREQAMPLPEPVDA